MPTSEEMRSWYEQYGYVLYKRCVRMLGSEEQARDALQEIFAQAWKYRKGYRRQAPPLHWLNRITTHHCLRLMRQRDTHTQTMDTATPIESANLAADIARRELVTKLLGHFDQRTQEVVVSTYMEGRSQDEVAQLLGISSRAVRKRLKQFREKAARLLQKWRLRA